MPDRAHFAISEPADIPEFFVEGFARIEEANGNLRFVFYATRQPAPGWPGTVDRVARVSLVMPIGKVCRCSMEAAEAVRKIDAAIYGMPH